MSVVVGFDPGLRLTGYAVLSAVDPKKVRIVEAGVLRMSASAPLAERVEQLHTSALELLDEHRPSSVAVEELFSHYDRPKTAILMGHARGVLLLAAAQRKIPVAHYLPTRVKKHLTGNGHADKEQIQQAIRMEFGISGKSGPADVSDAIAVAVCHLHAMKVADCLRTKK